MNAPAFDPNLAPPGDVAVPSNGRKCISRVDGAVCKYSHQPRAKECLLAPCYPKARPHGQYVIFLDATRSMATLLHPCGSLGEEVAPAQL